MDQPSSSQLWSTFKSRYAPSRLAMLQSGQLTLNNKTMNFVYKTKGKRPPNGYTLIFGFHGGGGCPAETNNQQYNNHKALYDNELPDGCIWFTPRSIEDVWDMWFQDYMEDYILEIIRAFHFNDLIDVNKVFLTGYSAGGDGVYHLAPRMADYLAGAAMMAGHPNGINFMNIRNIAFSVQVGGEDDAYNRKNEAIKYIRMLGQLGQNYGGFKNQSKIHAGKPHWMAKEDTKIFGWLFSNTRNPYPDTIIFKQCPRRKQTTFYYLRLGESKNGKNDEQIVAFKQGNTFKLYGNRKITVLLNSQMINPAETVTVYHNDALIGQRMMKEKQEVREKTLLERIDPFYIFEDEFESNPTTTVDMKATICKLFSISNEEKDAEYEKSLPIKPQETPANFSTSLLPLVQRKKPLTFGNPLQQTGQLIGQAGRQTTQLIGQGQSVVPSLQIAGQSSTGVINQITQNIQAQQPTLSPRSYPYLSQQQPQIQTQPQIQQQPIQGWTNWQDTPSSQYGANQWQAWQQPTQGYPQMSWQNQQQVYPQRSWDEQAQYLQQGYQQSPPQYVGQWQQQQQQPQQYPQQQYQYLPQQYQYQPQQSQYGGQQFQFQMKENQRMKPDSGKGQSYRTS